MSYEDLDFAALQSRFVEVGRPPRDAQIVDRTWQYVNKKGGPDRRFAHNPSRDVALYSSLILASASGLTQVFQFSQPTVAQSFSVALEGLKKVRQELRAGNQVGSKPEMTAV